MRNWIRDRLRELETERLATQQPEEAALLKRIQAGPPDRRISESAWESGCRHEWISCPEKETCCDDAECQMGLRCWYSVQKGQFGNGDPIPKKDRVRCEATTRNGEPCAMPVVPGKMRCKLHGGLSTGPRTPEGRARIAAAQRARWQKTKEICEPAPVAEPGPISVSRRLRNWRLCRPISPMAV